MRRLLTRPSFLGPDLLLILKNAGSLVGATALTSGLGFVFWWVAARRFSAESLGLAAACISAMTLLGTVGTLGLGTLLIGELAQRREGASALLSASLLAAGLCAGALGLLFVVLAPLISPSFRPLAADAPTVMLFATGVCLTGVTLVLDQAMVGMLKAHIQLWRNGLFAVIKLVLLFLIPMRNAAGLEIYAVWLLGNVFSLVPLAVLAFRGAGDFKQLRPELGLLRHLGSSALGHHALNLAVQAPSLILPVLVTSMLSAQVNAGFYVAWNIAGFAFVAPVALSTVLYAVASANPRTLASKLRMTGGFSFLASALAAAALGVAASALLRLFGQRYAGQGTMSLIVLSLAALPMVVKYHYVTLCRLRGQIISGTTVMAGAALFEMLAAAVGGHFYNLEGLCVGWLLANGVEAFCMLPSVYRAASGRRSMADSAPALSPDSPGAGVGSAVMVASSSTGGSDVAVTD